MEKLLLTVEETCGALAMGRTRFYEEVKAKRLVVVRSGKRTLVRADEARRYAAELKS